MESTLIDKKKTAFWFIFMRAAVNAILVFAVIYVLSGVLGIFFTTGPIPLGPISIGAPIFLFLGIEILLATTKTRSLVEKKGIYKKMSFLMILLIFIVTTYIAVALPSYIKQKKYEQQNPLIFGTRTYDFSKPVLINAQSNFKFNPIIENYKVAWIEQTKEFPIYPKNIWDLLLFEFNPVTSEGTLTSITNGKSINHADPENARLINGNLYWNVEGSNFEFNTLTRKTSIVTRDFIDTEQKNAPTPNNEFTVYKADNNNLILKKTNS